MAGVIVTFDPAAFKARYPEFAGVENGTLELYFAEATIYHRNDGTGPVSTAAVQSSLLNMLTAHIAARYATVAGVAPSNLVGRISQATQGSVTVAADYGTTQSENEAWYNQTKYGADYWRATAIFRGFHYVTGGRFPRGGRGFGFYGRR